MKKTFALIKENKILNIVAVDDADLSILDVLKKETGSSDAIECPVMCVISLSSDVDPILLMPHIGAQKEEDLFYPASWIKNEQDNSWSCPVSYPEKMLEQTDRFRWEESIKEWVTLPPSKDFV